MRLIKIIFPLLFLLVFIASSFTGKDTVVVEKKDEVIHLPYYSEASFTPIWKSPAAVSYDTVHRVSSFQLYNQEGATITDESLTGKIYITNFFFTTCPGICPRMTTNMFLLQEEFMKDDEVLLVSHTVTPEHDSVSVLKEYAEEHRINSDKWHLLTGSRTEIYRLGRKEYFVEEDLGLEKDEREFLHTENFVLVDKNKHIRGIYNGLKKSSVKQLIADINLLKEES